MAICNDSSDYVSAKICIPGTVKTFNLERIGDTNAFKLEIIKVQNYDYVLDIYPELVENYRREQDVIWSSYIQKYTRYFCMIIIQNWCISERSRFENLLHI